MLRVARILFLVVLVGVQVGSIALAPSAACETCRDGCAPGEPCGVDCHHCTACRAGVAADLVACPIPLTLVPVAAAPPAEGTLALPERLSEILHIPKSALA